MNKDQTPTSLPSESDLDQETISHIQKLKGISLSSTEAQQMRERLSAYADLHTSLPKTAVVSPFNFIISSYVLHARSFTAAALALVLVTGGVGITFAAQNSLPGQPLYAVKVSIAEPLQTALITNPTQKAQWQSTLASRRFSEASDLAAQDKLATTTQLYLQEEAATHIASAEKVAADLSAAGDAVAAVTVRTDLDAKLAVHADSLTTLAVKFAADGNATSTGAVLALLQQVDSVRSHVTLDQIAAQTSTASSTTSTEDASTTPAIIPIIAVATQQHDTLAAHGDEPKVMSIASMLNLNEPMLATSSQATSTATSTAAKLMAKVRAFQGEELRIKAAEDRLIPERLLQIPSDTQSESATSSSSL